MARIHLVIGPTGCGKSTFARELSERQGAVRFCVDEWMTVLFGPDRPDDTGRAWHAQRVERCSEHIWTISLDVLKLGVDVTLEIGLTQRAARHAFYERVDARKCELTVHVLDAPPDVRWGRVQLRNIDRGPTFSMEITREMFDFAEAMWEPPEETERAARDIQLVP